MSDDLLVTDDAREEFRLLMQDPAARGAFLQLKSQNEADGLRRRYTHVLQLVGEAVWAIREKEFRVICDILSLRAAGGRFTAEELDQRLGAARNEPDTMDDAGGVAILPIHGTIVPRADAFTEMSGGTSVEGLRAMFRAALNNPAIGTIILDIDSPGGMADQVPEFADEIRGSRGGKPIIAVANTLCASAAYWIASQADEVVVTKSGQVGSIGCITIHEEFSRMDEMNGITSTVITAGKYKGEGNPYEPLTDEAEAYMQSRVDAFYSMFVNAVSKGRGVGVKAVRGEDFGEGRMKMAREAVESKMADRVATLDEVIAGALGRRRRSESTAALAGTVHVDEGFLRAALDEARMLVQAHRDGVSAGEADEDEPVDDLDRIEQALEPTDEPEAPPDADPEDVEDEPDDPADDSTDEDSDSAEAPEGPEASNPAEAPEGVEANASLRAELEALKLTE